MGTLAGLVAPVRLGARGRDAALLAACSAETSKLETAARHTSAASTTAPPASASARPRSTAAVDRARAWVRQPASVNSYATGVRLFAFKTEKQRLNCDELAIGRREADAAPAVLRGPQAKGPPLVANRSLMFAGEVSKELTREASGVVVLEI